MEAALGRGQSMMRIVQSNKDAVLEQLRRARKRKLRAYPELEGTADEPEVLAIDC
jgi:hypothetical protein